MGRNTLSEQAGLPLSAVGSEYCIRGSVVFDHLVFLKNHLILCPHKPAPGFAVHRFKALIPGAGIGFVVSVGNYPLYLRIPIQPVPMGFFRGSVGTPKATAQFAKGLVELRNLFVDELNTGIFSILKPIQDAAIKNKNRLNGHTHF
jgi:hypothetical protein